MSDYLFWAVAVFGGVSLTGFFLTKSKGFGKYTTSALVILLAIVLSALFFAAGKIDAETMGNIFFAVIGFAGGMFTGKNNESSNYPGKPSKTNAEK